MDLCAGIGMLSFACEYRRMDITCLEFCPEYVVVGKRVMPTAHWIEGDVFKADLGRYTFAISNPPFGAIKGDEFKGRYTGGQFEYKVIELASRVAEYGVFILPQQSAPFRYSGAPCYRQEETDKCRKFREQTGIQMRSSCGIDTFMYVSEWKGVSPICEVIVCDFDEQPEASAQKVPMSVDLSKWEGYSGPLPMFAAAMVERLQHDETLVGKTADLFAEAV